nr:DinB family protein [uncultured Mucilaginibacter sp.]
MKTIFDKPTREEIINRVSALNQNSTPQWGKMTVYQMLKHCVKWEDMLLNKTQYKQVFMGRIFGRIALKNMLKDEPAKRNLPTVPEFNITGSGDIEAAKKEWIDLLTEHNDHEPAGFMHPFFGQLSADEAGRMAYKHTDHHLRQFNV